LNYINEVCYEEVFGRFLQREYNNAVESGHCPPHQEALVFDNDYSNSVKNQQRFLLLRYRWNLLCPIPRDTKWYNARIERKDLRELKMINEITWNVLSGGRGTINETVNKFRHWSENPHEIPAIQDPQVRQWLADLLVAIKGFRGQADKANQDLSLILVGTTKADHFTIIEGNKTSMGLYLHYVVDYPELDYPNQTAYVGISPAMNYYQWHHQF
jgi:hypothetical protein